MTPAEIIGLLRELRPTVPEALPQWHLTIVLFANAIGASADEIVRLCVARSS